MSDSEGVPPRRQRVLREGTAAVTSGSELELWRDEELLGDERTLPPTRQSAFSSCEYNVL